MIKVVNFTSIKIKKPSNPSIFYLELPPYPEHAQFLRSCCLRLNSLGLEVLHSVVPKSPLALPFIMTPIIPSHEIPICQVLPYP